MADEFNYFGRITDIKSFAREIGRCHRCNKKVDYHLHRVTYAGHFGDDKAMCTECVQEVTKNKKLGLFGEVL